MVDRADRLRTSVIDAQLEAQLQQEQVIERLRKGSIWDVYKILEDRGISRSEISKFFKLQSINLDQIIRPPRVYSDAAEPQTLEQYCQCSGYIQPPSQPEQRLTEQEKADIADGLIKGFGKAMAIVTGKSSTAKTSEVEDTGEKEKTPGETMAEATLEDYEAFMSDVAFSILEQQMMQEYKSKSAEAERELRRLIGLAKMGLADESVVLLACQKVKQIRSGVLVAYLGKKMLLFNEKVRKITEDMVSGGGYDLAKVRLGDASIKEIQTETMLISNDLQRLVQDIEAGLSSVHDIMSSIDKTKREIISKVAVR